MSRLLIPTVTAVLLLLPMGATGQGIPAISGVLKDTATSVVTEGMTPTLTLSVEDRPATFFAKCTFGEPAQEVQAESEVLEAGDPFVLALPADSGAKSAECAVVARFANGLSERKAVSMKWEVVPPLPEAEAGKPADAGEPPDQKPPSKNEADPSAAK